MKKDYMDKKALILDNTTLIDQKLIDKINFQYEDKYSFIMFKTNKDVKINLNYYITYNFFIKKNVYMNILIMNIILINNVINKESVELSFFIKYIMDNNIIEQKNFNYRDILWKIAKQKKSSKKELYEFENIISSLIKEHYVQESFFRKIKYELKKNKIIKIFCYKLINNVIYDMNKVIEEAIV